jgi:HSP20 family protein
MMRYPYGRDPFSELRQMFEDLGDFRGSGQYPPVDIRVEEDQLVLAAELPGVSREDLSLDVEGRHLTIRGEKPAPAEQEGDVSVHRERRFGSFERTFELGFEVDRDKIEASCRDGVLTVKLPKAEAAKPRKIEVMAG